MNDPERQRIEREKSHFEMRFTFGIGVQRQGIGTRIEFGITSFEFGDGHSRKTKIRSQRKRSFDRLPSVSTGSFGESFVELLDDVRLQLRLLAEQSEVRIG